MHQRMALLQITVTDLGVRILLEVYLCSPALFAPIIRRLRKDLLLHLALGLLHQLSASLLIN